MDARKITPLVVPDDIHPLLVHQGEAYGFPGIFRMVTSPSSNTKMQAGYSPSSSFHKVFGHLLLESKHGLHLRVKCRCTVNNIM